MVFAKTYFSNESGIALSLFFCLLWGMNPCSGQSYHFEKLTTGDGLSQNTINCIYQDSQGFLWLGTQDGLNKYDGYEISIYRHEVEDTGSISHSWIWDIIEDNDQNLWVATWNGLNKMSSYSNSFERYKTDPSDSGYRGDRPTSFSLDPESDLWIGTWGEGLNRFDYRQKRFFNYSANQDNDVSLPSNLIRDLLHDKRGSLWLGTWNGLCRIDSVNEGNIVEITIFQHDPENNKSLSDNRITSLFEDSMGYLWIGTLEGGLNKFNPSTREFIRYLHDSDNDCTISGNDISSIQVDRRGCMWVGTFSNGLNKSDIKGECFESIHYNSKDAGSLAGNSVFSIYEDRSGLIWIGANALNKYNPLNERFHHLKHEPDNPSSLSHDNVGAIYETRDGSIWIGTEEGGVNLYDRDKGIFKNIPVRIDPSNTSMDLSIGSIVEDIYGNIWIGTRRNGIFIYDQEKQTFRSYPFGDHNGVDEDLKYVNFLETDNKGQLWIATFNNGLFVLNIREKTIRNYKYDPEDPNSLSGNYLLRLFRDEGDRIWIASWGGGLCVYDNINQKFERYLHNPEDSTSIADNIVYAIQISRIGARYVLWAGTGAGLSFAVMDAWPDLSFKSITIQDGLPNNTIYSIQNDNNGNLWISTNYGLCKYDPLNSKFHNYFQEDGLQANEFNGGAGFRTSDGLLIFGGINGLNIFPPDSIKATTFSPNIMITNVYVYNDIFLTGRPIYEKDKIELNYQQNFFSFEFSALDFAQPQKIQYAYMLEGVDRSWVYSQNRRLANYTDIDPGMYVFKVKSTNSEQIWRDNETRLEISIIPPFWKTWWFRSLVILLFLGLIYMGHRFRVRKILELERLRVRIASDLHDDFGSSLTRIAIHSEQIQNSNNQKIIHQISGKIGAISREVISSMSDIVWSIDARNDTLKNLIDRMQEINVNTLSISDIDVTFTHKGMARKKSIPVDSRQNIYYIYKEAINNIAKHSAASSVEINLDNSDNQFRMYIRDNGNGFDPSQIKEGNGLKNMEMRAKRIGADFSIRSRRGTEIILKMKKL